MSKQNSLEGIIARAHKAIEQSKKLTTKDRKKLKSSTFCGPNRSFPVPDCKHVATAKAYLGRSKFSSSTKKKIASCINRKAKQLGCNVSKKAKADRDYLFYRELGAEEKELYRSDIFKSTKELVEQSLKNPGMDLKFDVEIEPAYEGEE
jgi:ribosomal protein L4